MTRRRGEPSCRLEFKTSWQQLALEQLAQLSLGTYGSRIFSHICLLFHYLLFSAYCFLIIQQFWIGKFVCDILVLNYFILCIEILHKLCLITHWYRVTFVLSFKKMRLTHLLCWWYGGTLVVAFIRYRNSDSVFPLQHTGGMACNAGWSAVVAGTCCHAACCVVYHIDNYAWLTQLCCAVHAIMLRWQFVWCFGSKLWNSAVLSAGHHTWQFKRLLKTFLFCGSRTFWCCLLAHCINYLT